MDSFIYFILGIFATIWTAYLFRFKLYDILVEIAEIAESKKLAEIISNIAKKTKDTKKAIELYEKAIKLGDTRLLPLFNLSHLFLKTSNFDKAIQYADLAIEKAKSVKIYQNQLASTYLHKFNILFSDSKSNKMNCEFFILEAIKLEQNIIFYNNVISYYLVMNNLTLAKKYLNDLKTIDPQSFFYFYNNALILRREKKYEEALNNVSIAYSIDKSLEGAKVLYEDLLYENKSINETGGIPITDEQKTEIAFVKLK